MQGLLTRLVFAYASNQFLKTAVEIPSLDNNGKAYSERACDRDVASKSAQIFANA